MSRYAQYTRRRTATQRDQLPGEVPNSAGGFVFQIDCWGRLDRFLILGAEGGTYYSSEQKLTKENVGVIEECVRTDYRRTVDTIVQIVTSGRAPRPTAAIFALTYLAGYQALEVRQKALSALNEVCKTGTHLFQFLADIEEFRGWGRGLRRAVSNWYLSKDPRTLAYQITKYQQRGGESHRDALRRAHPATSDVSMNTVLRYAVGKQEVPPEWLTSEHGHERLLAAVEAAKKATTKQQIVKLIEDHALVRECIPSQWLNEPDVWSALLEKMPMMAMIRNLGKMSAIELVKPMSASSMIVRARLTDVELIKRSGVHPYAILLANATYGQGHGFRGKLRWTVDPDVLDALDDAFYLAFENIKPTGKRWLLGIDVSGSMSCSFSNGPLTAAKAAAAMAMATFRSEQQCYAHGFAGVFKDLGLTRTMLLRDVLQRTNERNFGRTDCALPMIWAAAHQIPVDTFVVYTDNETWCGDVKPNHALQRYRDKMGIPSKLAVVGIAATGFSIADPNDAGMMDFVGFDASAPAVLADFARGDVAKAVESS